MALATIPAARWLARGRVDKTVWNLSEFIETRRDASHRKEKRRPSAWCEIADRNDHMKEGK